MNNLAVKLNVIEQDDPYRSRPGSLTLSNLLGINDAIDLKNAELVLSSARRIQGLPWGSYDWEHYKSIHQHLFQDVYAWAGEPRTVEMNSPTNAEFCKTSRIETEAQRIFDDLKKNNGLVGLDQEEFTVAAARLYSSLNRLHPFRTGNGRVARVFIEELAKNVGLTFNWKSVTRAEWNHASHQAYGGNLEHLHGVLAKASCPAGIVYRAKNEGVRPPTVKQKNMVMGNIIKNIKKQIVSGKRMDGQADDDFVQEKKSTFSPN